MALLRAEMRTKRKEPVTQVIGCPRALQGGRAAALHPAWDMAGIDEDRGGHPGGPGWETGSPASAHPSVGY